MTRKDYIKLAEALMFARGHANAARAGKAFELSGVTAAAEYIANALRDDDPHFDREHFLAVVRGERRLYDSQG